MILTIRNFEFLNILFLYVDTAEVNIIIKYTNVIFKRLESLMLILTNVEDFDYKTYLPVGVITTLVGSLFGNLMRFYREGVYKDVLSTNKNLNTFRLDTKILRDCVMKIWIKLSNECNSCIHELVLESLSNCIVYLEFDEVDQKDLFSVCSDLINSDYYPIEIGAYNILDRFVLQKKIVQLFNFHVLVIKQKVYIICIFNVADCASCVKWMWKQTRKLIKSLMNSVHYHYNDFKT